MLKKKDFDAVWQKGRSSFDKFLGIKVLGSGLKANRFGIMVGLKVSKKRRIREIIGAETEKLEPGFDIVITVLPAARELGFAELQESIIYNLQKLKLLRGTCR